MAKEPLLTRKAYREQLERAQFEAKAMDEHISRNSVDQPIREEVPAEHRLPVKKKSGYNTFLNSWIILILLLLIGVICIQIFL